MFDHWRAKALTLYGFCMAIKSVQIIFLFNISQCIHMQNLMENLIFRSNVVWIHNLTELRGVNVKTWCKGSPKPVRVRKGLNCGVCIYSNWCLFTAYLCSGSIYEPPSLKQPCKCNQISLINWWDASIMPLGLGCSVHLFLLWHPKTANMDKI